MAAPRLRFSFKVYRRPFREPVRTSYGVWEARDGILIRVEQENGRAGFGEIAPIDRFGTETIAGALLWCANIGAMSDIARLRDVPRRLPCCVAAVQAALAMLAEGEASTGPRRLNIACLLPAGASVNDALARAVDVGFTTFKIKIGAGDVATEQAGIARLLERLPPGGHLRLDANGGLDARKAARWLDAAADWPVEFIEQPLPVEADRDLVRLARDHVTPVALDESVRGPDDLKRWRDRGWPGIFVIKPALAGAADELIAEVRIAPESVVFSSALETAIGAVAGVRLAFAAGVTRALGYGVGAFFPDDGLGGALLRPNLAASDLAAEKPEDVWNRL